MVTALVLHTSCMLHANAGLHAEDNLSMNTGVLTFMQL